MLNTNHQCLETAAERLVAFRFETAAERLVHLRFNSLDSPLSNLGEINTTDIGFATENVFCSTTVILE